MTADNAAEPGEGGNDLRRQLTDELHARPQKHIAAPARVSHFALLTGEPEESVAADHAHLADLCGRFEVQPPPPNAKHFTADFGPFHLRWERHSEFTCYTVFVAGAFDDPFQGAASDQLPGDWLDAVSGELLVAAALAFAAEETIEDGVSRSGWFARESLCCSQVSDGMATVWTDFRIHDDGFSRFLVVDHGLTRRRAGRLIQRLLDIETYRTMALLALPEARRIGPDITRIDGTLARSSATLSRMTSVDDERDLLNKLTGLAAEMEALQAATSYRFGAARAYEALVEARITELREERVAGWQTVGEFMSRRFAPAMRTCHSAARRLDQLSPRVTRASTLLRTRVDIALEDQSQALLTSVERSTRRQVRLQQTVEGLSVAAISYYLLGLIAYAAAALEGVVPFLSPKIAAGVALPFVIAGVWLGVRHLRRRHISLD
jgi:uncharacterized membrane-anchored protein